MLHEADLVRGGRAEGTGATSVEHFVPQSTNTNLRNEYHNCFYCCKDCNTARSNLAVVKATRRLLNPTLDAWASHFVVNGDRLDPIAGDKDAAYTHETYDLNDARKVSYRKIRREFIEDRLAGLAKVTVLLSRLMERVDQNIDDPEAVELLILSAEVNQNSLERLLKDLEDFAIIPLDADKKCRCEDKVTLGLPEFLRAQSLDV